jgi:predicted glycoside hydrolase/deacetylase ChbG (UPF0249 family)
VAKTLIVNADDFGFTRGVNKGIVEAHRNGILTATTLMADGPAFDHAVELARATPSLDVGVHLVLWPDGDLPQRLPALLRRAFALSTPEIEALFARQVEKVLSAGLQPSHLDTHKHTHSLPHVFRAMARVAQRFRIPWVRRPLIPGPWSAVSGLRTTDHFAGLCLTGRLDRPALARLLPGLRPGITELMCHPGRYDAALETAPTRLKRQRQVELEALTDQGIRDILRQYGLQLRSFRSAL